MSARSPRIVVLFIGALLSLLAAYIHVLVTGEHFEEWWGYGAFFLATVIAQGLYAPLLMWRPRNTVLIVGIAGNTAIVLMWVVSRFIGVPVGPGAGEIEPVARLDVICTLAEIALIQVLVWELARMNSKEQSAQLSAQPEMATR